MASCRGCRQRIRVYHDAGFEIIGVSLDESKTAVVDFAKVRKLPWPQIHNASSTVDLVEAFGVGSIPATYLIDPEGTVIRLDLRGKALERDAGAADQGDRRACPGTLTHRCAVDNPLARDHAAR